jgi:uncharacterized repeat protein (TIGR04138 family)
MWMRHAALAEMVRRDPRYAYEAYEFVYNALHHTQKLLGRVAKKEEEPTGENHVSGPQLLQGVRDLALREYGLMARVVFRCWGINSTADFGEIVFNLVDAGLMNKTAEDRREDFHNVYNLDEALRHYEIKLDELETP